MPAVSSAHTLAEELRIRRSEERVRHRHRGRRRVLRHRHVIGRRAGRSRRITGRAALDAIRIVRLPGGIWRDRGTRRVGVEDITAGFRLAGAGSPDWTEMVSAKAGEAPQASNASTPTLGSKRENLRGIGPSPHHSFTAPLTLKRPITGGTRIDTQFPCHDSETEDCEGFSSDERESSVSGNLTQSSGTATRVNSRERTAPTTRNAQCRKRYQSPPIIS